MKEKPKKQGTKTTQSTYICTYCHKRFNTYNSWDFHIKLHSSDMPYECLICDYKCKVKKYLTSHVKKAHTKPTGNQCAVCGKCFHFECKLKVHMRVHTGEKPYSCTECEKTFSSSYSLNVHKLIHTGEKPYHCQYCDYACRDNSTIRRHIERHMGYTKDYPCSICNKNFKKKETLQLHVDEVHFELDTRKLPCKQCNKIFKTKGTLNSHIRTVHNAASRVNCEICGVKVTKTNIQAHMRRHIDVRPYKCSYKPCGRRFKDKGDLKKHSLIHYPSRQHQCTVCYRRFPRKSRLAKHLSSHMNGHHVQCDYCLEMFSTKMYLSRHIKKSHGPDADAKKYICDVCGVVTFSRRNITRHLIYGHGHEKDTKCHICNKNLNNHLNLKEHYLKHHNVKYTLPDSMKEEEISIKQEPFEALEEMCDPPEFNYEVDIQKHEIDVELDVLPPPSPQDYPIDSDTITYSKKVLSEDISRSLIERENFTEDVFDDFFIGHVMKRPEEIDVPKQIVDEKKKERVEKCLDKLLKQVKIRRECKVLEKLRREYNKRIKMAYSCGNRPEPKSIRYFKKTDGISETQNNHENEGIGDDIQMLNNGDGNNSVGNKTVTNSVENNSNKTNNNNKGNNNIVDNRTCNVNKNHGDSYGINDNKNANYIHEFTNRYDENHGFNKEIHSNNNRNASTKITEVLGNDIHENNHRNDESHGTDKEIHNKTHENTNREVSNEIGHEKAVHGDDNHNKNTENGDEEADDDDFNDDDAKDSDFETNSDEDTNDNGKIKFNTHQCYICFKLFKTKAELKQHCTCHFDICNEKMLKKCPFCGYVTNLHIRRHIQLVHKLDITIPYSKVKERNTENGSKYFFEIDKNCDLEIIPSISNLNKIASMKIDEENRKNKNVFLGKTKLIKKGGDWVVEKEAVSVSNEFLLPKFSKDDYLSLKSVGDTYLERIRNLSVIAKKKGFKILYPCEGCDKICLTMSALKLHNRKHEANPKMYKPKVWKNKILTGKGGIYKNKLKKGNNNQNFAITNQNCVITNQNKNKNTRKSNKYSRKLEKVNEKQEIVVPNRFADPNPVKNKHKCDKKLIEFYKNNIKGGDIEFWQFLKIFNKMARENVNDFNDLNNRYDFGNHNIKITENIPEEKPTESTKVDNDREIRKKPKKICKKGARVILISKKEYLKRIEMKNEMRRRLTANKS